MGYCSSQTLRLLDLTKESPRGLQPLTNVTVIEELLSSQMGIYLGKYRIRPTGHPADDLLRLIGAHSQVDVPDEQDDA